MSSTPNLLSTVWAIAEIVCEQGRSSSALFHDTHRGVADYFGVTAFFEGADLVRLKGPGLDLFIKRYLRRTGGFSMPSFSESGYAYRFDQGDIISLYALLRDLKIMQPSKISQASFSESFAA